MIVFLFGLPGAGKTYIGQLMQEKLAALYWDGDEALTEEMREAVRQEKPFSQTMTQTLTATLIHKIKALQNENDFIVVSQAMLRESDREIFRQQFDSIQFLYISCGNELLNQRIIKRADMVSVSYLETLINAFEPHRKQAESYPVIHNDNKTDEQLIEEVTSKLPPLPNQTAMGWPNFFSIPKMTFPELENSFKACMPSL